MLNIDHKWSKMRLWSQILKKCVFSPEISCVRRIYVYEFQSRRAVLNIWISEVKGGVKTDSRGTSTYCPLIIGARYTEVE